MTQEKMNIIIAIISAVATFAAAIIYYKTLQELKKQRQNTYRPHLFIDSISFNVIGVERNNFTLPLHWTDKKEDHNTIKKFGNNLNTHHFNLKCYNIGFGTAKKVKIHFHFDVPDFINKINIMGTEVDPSLAIDIEYKPNFVSFDSKNDKLPLIRRVIRPDLAKKDYLSYVLPVSVGNSFVPVRMPIIYLELLNICVHHFSNIKDGSKWRQDEHWNTMFPIINATLTYEDIYNVVETKNIEIKTEMHVLSSSGYTGAFNIKEI